MMIGHIFGKTTTAQFDVKLVAQASKRAFVQVKVGDDDVLAQITEIEKTNTETKARCNIIGRGSEGFGLKPLMEAPSPNTQVFLAKPSFIDASLGLSKAKNGAFIGLLQGYDQIRVNLDLNR